MVRLALRRVYFLCNLLKTFIVSKSQGGDSQGKVFLFLIITDTDLKVKS